MNIAGFYNFLICLIIYICVCVCVWVCIDECWCLWKLEVSKSTEVWSSVICDQPNMLLETKFSSSTKEVWYLNHWSIFPSSHWILLLFIIIIIIIIITTIIINGSDDSSIGGGSGWSVCSNTGVFLAQHTLEVREQLWESVLFVQCVGAVDRIKVLQNLLGNALYEFMNLTHFLFASCFTFTVTEMSSQFLAQVPCSLVTKTTMGSSSVTISQNKLLLPQIAPSSDVLAEQQKRK